MLISLNLEVEADTRQSCMDFSDFLDEGFRQDLPGKLAGFSVLGELRSKSWP